MKRLSIALLTATIGVSGVTVGAAEVCGVDFKEVWAAKVKAIQQWNKSHASYVARHHLDNPALEANTRRMKERARKALEVMCGSRLDSDLSGVFGDNYSGGRDLTDSTSRDLPAYMEAEEPISLTALIAQEEYPTYDNPNVAYEGSAGGLGYWPWGYPTYFPIVQSGGTRTPSFPVGPTIPNPVGPIAATPESGTFVLSAVPMLALCLLGRKKKGDL
jgi:hypothetical protein